MNTRTLILATTLCISASAEAAVFCVGDSAALTQALATAGSNAWTDAIRIREGTYSAPVGGWTYFPNPSDQDYYLSITGGWDANCGLQSLDSSLTKLSGGFARRVLAVSRGNGSSAELEISGLSLVNGFSSSQDYETNLGLALRVYSHAHSGPLRVENVIVRDNSSLHGLSSVFLSSKGPIHFRNNLVADNDSGNGSMGVTFVGSGTAYVSNNTIVNNVTLSTPSIGMGLDVSGGTGARYLSNNIVWGNATFANSWDVDSDPMVLMIGNNIGSMYGTNAAGSSSNTAVDPMFQSPADYRLQPGSPLHNAGVNAPLGGLASYDLLGMARILNGVTDVGAYESQMSAIFKNSFE